MSRPTTCPKCSSLSPRVLFHDPARGNVNHADMRICDGMRGEHLHAFCTGCRFEWIEDCDDVDSPVSSNRSSQTPVA